MKVLLIKDVKSLGKAGEIKEVKEGYGHNFLIAKGYAKAATTDVLRQYEAAKKREAEELKYELANLEKLKDELARLSVVITKQLGANGSLFGSVSKEEIAEALKAQHGIEIDKKSIETDKHGIKATGIYELDVKLGHAIHAKLKLDVRGE
ncbi:50S ribosomal protein L9 [Campylobacter sp. 19-13652]|uniref:50S ribosomal protein L9 n=1 Tax=Campylobacter sp. 19-13652 TaxID=2840180 RepID=UPI001C789531|nr:50S ribosomal protein L9 [Campylobacter sp. 19-13652]BCX79823.1 50S ribosomal protein L9 [Campylobacter sp. 19-13652]